MPLGTFSFLKAVHMTPEVTSINRYAVVSLLAGMLGLLALCIGVIPVPLTGFVCFPSAAILCATSVVCGAVALGQLQAGRESGRGIALLGLATGGLTLAAGMCITVVGFALLSRLAESVRLWTR
jgi:hypothetical protein